VEEGGREGVAASVLVPGREVAWGGRRGAAVQWGTARLPTSVKRRQAHMRVHRVQELCVGMYCIVK